MRDVKRTFIIYFLPLMATVFMLYAQTAKAQTKNDSVEVALLTCSPGQQVYALYGHTAIRYHDLRTGEDWVFNYGIFSFKQPHFVWRFALGKTDYELGVMPYNIFRDEYASEGRSIIAQTLNLTYDEKEKLFNALKENFMPENRTYRYNFFYDNCTTRARDMIEKNINGKLNLPENKDVTSSFRKMVHDYNSAHPWARFGNDMLLGMKADYKTNARQQEFLPVNLLHDFNDATITGPDGITRSLLISTKTILQPGVQTINKEFPLSPMECAITLLIITVIIMIFEYTQNKTVWIYDTILMLVQGVAGCVILFMFFSEHPTTSTNLLILLLNPAPLFFIPKMIKKARKHQKDVYFVYANILLVLYFIVLAFGIQEFPPAMSIVALSLLLRSISRFVLERKTVIENKK